MKFNLLLKEQGIVLSHGFIKNIMTRNFVMEKISRESDELARQYNRSKDPGIRDQWYELLRKVSQAESKDRLERNQT